MNTVRSKRWGHRRLVLQAPAGYLGMKHVLGNEIYFDKTITSLWKPSPFLS